MQCNAETLQLVFRSLPLQVSSLQLSIPLITLTLQTPSRFISTQFLPINNLDI